MKRRNPRRTGKRRKRIDEGLSASDAFAQLLKESVTWSDDEPEAEEQPPKPDIRPVDYDRLGAPISRRAAAGLPGLGKRR